MQRGDKGFTYTQTWTRLRFSRRYAPEGSRKGDFWKRGTINLILDTIKSMTVETELILKSPGCDFEIKSASRVT